MTIVANLLMIAAAALLLILAIDVIGAMRRRGAWALCGTWIAIACAALLSGVQWDAVPLPVAVLLLALAVLLWRQRGRLRWAAERGRW